MRLARACHRDRAAFVFQSLLRFVADRRAKTFGFGSRQVRVAAALDHERVDDPVENGPVVESVIHVAQEVLAGFGRLVGMEFRDEFPQARLEPDARSAVGGRFLWLRCRFFLHDDLP